MKEILYIKPIFKDMIWGGTKLRSEYGYEIPTESTGECWAISAHDNGDCYVESESFKGYTLSQLWREHRELFGHMEGDRFPLLIKIIDAKTDLSIQVHPDDDYAYVNEIGSLGKTECWYVLDCDKDATIVIGHNASTKDELKHMIHTGAWNELIRILPIKKGDFFQINPGTVHAIKGGTMILETQQSSDITYRLYDYDRLQNGVKRELHIDKSIDVITCPHVDYMHVDYINEKKIESFGTGVIEELVKCKYYTVNKLTVSGEVTMTQNEYFTLISVIEGDGKIDGMHITKGNHFILPNGYGNYKIEGNIVLSLAHC